MIAARVVVFVCVLVTARGAGAQSPPSGAQDRPFTEEATWSFKLGTDAAVTLSNLESGSSNERNDRSTNLDGLWLRLYAKLAYGDKALFLVDLYSSEGESPRIFGLYGQVQPDPRIGVRAGLIPMVVGSWQDRAYPSRQPLIGEPVPFQYLLSLRIDSIPRTTDELVDHRARGGGAFGLAVPGKEMHVTVAYEQCWDTGVAVFGTSGRLGYQVAAMEGTPGSPVTRMRLPSRGQPRDDRKGASIEGRLTYRLTDAVRIGVSAARGSYLRASVQSVLPAGASIEDYRQELAGADLRIRKGRVEAHGDYLFSRYRSPFVPEALDAHGYSGEASLELTPGLRAAVRFSGLAFSDVRDSRGRTVAWEAPVARLEAGAVWRFYEDHVAVKAAYQRTEVKAEPRRVEDLGALQLSFHY
jgi:hypothetical protein